MRSLIVIPAYNEAGSIASVIREVQALHPQLDMLVVDDGSSDSTSELAESLGVKVLRLPFNLGYGAAVQTGLVYAVEADYEACVLIDGDGQMNPKDIDGLLTQVADNQVDLALGSRFLGKTDYALPLTRRLGIALFSKMTSFFTHQQITDPTSGFQVIGRRLMEFFVKDNYPADFPDADTIIRLYFAGFKIKEVPVTIRARLQGKSMHGGASALYYVYKMLFSILIALTQRNMLAKGGDRAISNQGNDHCFKSGGDADHCEPRASETAR
jgi:glycosyltransferase involved in cell wall biosynthesis